MHYRLTVRVQFVLGFNTGQKISNLNWKVPQKCWGCGLTKAADINNPAKLKNDPKCAD